MKIFKYEVAPMTVYSMKLTPYDKPISYLFRDGKWWLYIEHHRSTMGKEKVRSFFAFPTGEYKIGPSDTPKAFIGTATDGNLVFHLYELL